MNRRDSYFGEHTSDELLPGSTGSQFLSGCGNMPFLRCTQGSANMWLDLAHVFDCADAGSTANAMTMPSIGEE